MKKGERKRPLSSSILGALAVFATAAGCSGVKLPSPSGSAADSADDTVILCQSGAVASAATPAASPTPAPAPASAPSTGTTPMATTAPATGTTAAATPAPNPPPPQQQPEDQPHRGQGQHDGFGKGMNLADAGLALLASAGTCPVGTIPVSIGPFQDTTVPAMAAQLYSEYTSGTGYKTWNKTSVQPVVSLNLAGAVSFVNPALYAAITANAAEPPAGSAAVLEIYNDAAGKSLQGWAVLAAAFGSTDPSAWFSLQLANQNDSGSAATATTDSMGAAACASCHTGQPQYMMPLTFQ